MWSRVSSAARRCSIFRKLSPAPAGRLGIMARFAVSRHPPFSRPRKPVSGLCSRYGNGCSRPLTRVHRVPTLTLAIAGRKISRPRAEARAEVLRSIASPPQMIGRRGRPRLTTTEMSVDPTTTSRRTFLKVAVGVPLTGAALAACGSSGPTQAGAGGGGGNAGSAGSGTATYWFLSGPPGEAIRQASVNRFNQANPNTKIKATTFQNDAYKAKIKTAIGAGQAPTIIWGWGGGGLKSYVDAGQVDDLTSWFAQNSAVKDRLFPSAFGAATVNNKIYAMPAEQVQPIILYYNKKVLDQVGIQPPQSWAEIMAAVPKINAKGIAPFSLGGQSRWTNMMWLEFLLDRIGGPDVFQAVFAGQKGAWSNPAVTEMLTKIQDLVKANGFVKGFSSITADSNADQALL